MSIANQMKTAGKTLAATTLVALATSSPAMAWGHSSPDKLRNAFIGSAVLAGGVVAIRANRRRKQAQSKSTLG